MALTNTYCDFATGNDYSGATFTDGAYTSATKTLVKAGAFAKTKVNHWLYLESNDGGSIVAGYYKVTSVPDANTVTLATDAGNGTDDDAAKCVQHDGTTAKPWRSVQGALDLITRDATNGDQINVKAGTAQVLSASLSLTTYGTPSALAQLVIRGYTTAANDGGCGEIDCGGSTLISPNTLSFIALIDLELHTMGNNHGIYLGDYCSITHCHIHMGASSPSGKYAVLLGKHSLIIGSFLPAYGTGVAAEAAAAEGSSIIWNYIISHNIGALAYGSGPNVKCIGNIIVAPGASNGISNGPRGITIHNIVMASSGNTGYGIKPSTGASYGTICINNIVANFSGAGGIGIYVEGKTHMLAANAYYNCTTNLRVDAYAHYDLSGEMDVQLTADPFTDATNGDFSLTAAAKAALAGKGWPTSYLGAAEGTVPNITIGAIQQALATGGGGFPKIASLLGRTRM